MRVLNRSGERVPKNFRSELGVRLCGDGDLAFDCAFDGVVPVVAVTEASLVAASEGVPILLCLCADDVEEVAFICVIGVRGLLLLSDECFRCPKCAG